MTDFGKYHWSKVLTVKEWEALRTYASCLSYKATAHHLNKSQGAVDALLLSARRKMGAISTADALAKLVEWDHKSASATSKAVLNENETSIDKGREDVALWPAKNSSHWKWFAITLCVGLSIVAMHSMRSRGETQSSAAPERQSMSALVGDIKADGQDYSKSAPLVEELCRRFWPDVWTRNEVADVSLAQSVSGEISGAFKWCMKNDPEGAVVIAGDGHRTLSKANLPVPWDQMVHEAAALNDVPENQYMGRVLCGVALADWSVDPQVGAASARRAIKIFQADGLTWDEANAWRHLGLCTVNDSVDNESSGRADYARAMHIFQELGDGRGIGQCYLSLGQVPHPTDLEKAHNLTEAGSIFMAQGDFYSNAECVSELMSLLARIGTLHGWADPFWSFVRSEAQLSFDNGDYTKGAELQKFVCFGDLSDHADSKLGMDLNRFLQSYGKVISDEPASRLLIVACNNLNKSNEYKLTDASKLEYEHVEMLGGLPDPSQHGISEALNRYLIYK